jgi:hypothetical protein
MTNISDSTVKLSPHYFGGCPICGDHSGYLNVGGNHWFVCNAHRMRWCAGYNLFSGWHDESASVWSRNAQLLAGYEACIPMPPALEKTKGTEGTRPRATSAPAAPEIAAVFTVIESGPAGAREKHCKVTLASGEAIQVQLNVDDCETFASIIDRGRIPF